LKLSRGAWRNWKQNRSRLKIAEGLIRSSSPALGGSERRRGTPRIMPRHLWDLKAVELLTGGGWGGSDAAPFTRVPHREKKIWEGQR
jgi:hypothetical protein